jgi:hypothetical protein
MSQRAEPGATRTQATPPLPTETIESATVQEGVSR